MTDDRLDKLESLACDILAEVKALRAEKVSVEVPVESPPIIKLPDEVRLLKGEPLQEACERVKSGGRIVTVPAGVSLPLQVVHGLGDKPFWLRAEQPGEAEISALAPMGKWNEEKNGIWSRHQGMEPWAGSCVEEGLYLANYQSLDVLTGKHFKGVNKNSGKTETHKKTEYGFVHAKGKLFVRLPKGMDPNKLTMEFDNGLNQKILRIDDCPGMIVDGFRFAGSGLKEAICVTGRSEGITLRNNVMEICRFGARLVDDCRMSWNEYRFPGFRRWMKDMKALNGTNHSAFAFVKFVYTDPDNINNPLIGGRIAQGGKTSTRNCRFDHNLGREIWDFHRYGQFERSEIYRDVGCGIGDDFVEFEGIWNMHSGHNNKVTECWALDCLGSYFSAQDRNTLEGPGHIKGCVMGSTDPDFFPVYAIKDFWLNKAGTFAFEDCLIHMPHDGRHSSWGDTRWIIAAGKKANPEKIRLINSVLVAKRLSGWNNPDKPNVADNFMIGENAEEYTGNGGSYGGPDPAMFFEGWTDINTMPSRLLPTGSLAGVGPNSYEPPRSLEREFNPDPPEAFA